MSFVGGGLSIGGPGDPMRFGQTRGRIGNSFAQGVTYPSPFFDLAHTYFPVTVKALFRWCRYYFLTNPIVNAVVFKLSEYPVTDLIIDHPNKDVVNKWTEYFTDHLQYKPFMVECGLDYFVYGTTLPSLVFPLKKFLTCKSCGFREEAKKIRPHWSYTNYEFRMTCPKCGNTGNADAKDWYFKNASGIRLIRWSPEDIDVRTDELSGETTYFYNVQPTLKNDAVLGKKDIVEKTPQVILQAMRQQKSVVLTKDLIFQMKRPSLAGQDRGYGTPLLLASLKNLFYLQIMQKAQEAILLESILPLRVIFPQLGSGAADPYCVSPDTLVETLSGLRPASEVRENDYLRSHTGAWRRVEALKVRDVLKKEKVFRLSVSSITAFKSVFSEDHPILAVKRTSRRERQNWVDPEFMPIKDLRKGDYVAYPVRRTIANYTDLDLADYSDRGCTDQYIYRRLNSQAAEIYEWLEDHGDPTFAHGERKSFLSSRGWSDSNYAVAYAMRREERVDRVVRTIPINKELATLIGYYLAEGFITDGGSAAFALNSNESVYADEIESAAISLGFRHASRHLSNQHNSMTVVVEDVFLGELLKGLCGKGFANKTIPQIISEAPATIMLEMLRCLFNGDGCSFTTETNRVALKTSNPNLALEARRLLLSLGLIGCVSREVMDEKDIAKADAFHLNYNGEQATALRALFNYSSMGGPPRSNCGVIRGDYVLLRITEIEEVLDTPKVIGFQMAGDKSFCVAGIATHNSTVNLVDWRDHVAMEIARWRRDPNYIPVFPLPIGTQTIGGDGRALLLTQEMQLHGEQLINGLQCPLEFVKGGLSFSGSSVSMRMMENHFISYISRHKQMANWVMREVANYMGWPVAKIRFKPFKMADDIQRKAYLFQLNQTNKISDTTLLADADLNQEEEDEIMLRETTTRMRATEKQQLAMAELQGKQQAVLMKQQVKAQQEMQEAMAAPNAPGEPGGPDGSSPVMDPMAQASSPLNGQQKLPSGQDPNGAAQPGAGGADIVSVASNLASQLAMMDQAAQNAALQQVKANSPEIYPLVIQFLVGLNGANPQMQQGAQNGSANGAAASQINMQPLPENKPPRRAAGII